MTYQKRPRSFQGMLIQIRSPGGIQLNKPCGIRVTENPQAFSESIPRASPKFAGIPWTSGISGFPGNIENACRIGPKSLSEGIPAHPKSAQNRSRDPLGSPKKPQRRPAAPRNVPRSPRAWPRSHPGAARDALGYHKEHLGAPGITPRR